MKPAAAKEKTRSSGRARSYPKTRVRVSRLYEAAFILAFIELSRRLHQAYRQAYDKQAAEWLLPPNTASYNGVRSNSTFDITDKTVQVELAQAISQAGWCENFLQVGLDANNYFMIDVGATSMVLRARVNGVNDQTVISFDATAHRHWRIRHNQGSNTVTFDTSPDASNWTTRKTVTAAFSLTALRFYLYAGAWGTGNSNPGAAKYDNFQLVTNSGSTASVQWLVSDQLGTPRMVFDKTGSLANTKRHDYLPFGEELFAGTGNRTPQQGYVADNVRQKFTSKERDIETGLDYFGARYHSSTQGRFSGVDPLLESAVPSMPQSWNRYSYVLNNPLAYTDPTGEIWVRSGSGNIVWFSQERWDEEISTLKDSKGNALYTPLTSSEMELNTNFGRVRLNPEGPDADAPGGSDAYLGFSIVGENKTDFSVALAAGIAIGAKGKSPFLLMSGATIATLWVLTSPVQQGLPMVDNNFYSQSKHNKEVIEGLIGTAVDHIEKIKNNPGSSSADHWKGEVKAVLDRAKNIADRLKGKTKEAIKERIKDLENQANSN